ncbi:3-hydroxyisobutyryl-CoA hydrolase 1-like isoform X3 [Mangifera indica]|uniref:3-hydroxyisobutyryl-CoA hydrolase 1-like isoform X3 n=1 Tax=Mangifera indica TaxID=29780 RepID=UPI001CFBB808|nr:3-hydroxyisobutyryl-CoA hydrolase 1-like isoform X3 [Mangifera indica]
MNQQQQQQQQDVVFEGNSCVKKVTLNRPRKLNSLTYGMVSQMLKKLNEFETDPSVKLVILKGNGKAFCSGGDIVDLYGHSPPGQWRLKESFYKKQLIIDYLLATYKKPLVALINGIVMGGGAGLSMHAKFKIVTENTVFAMPEVAIGHVPDVGASHFLSRLPGYFGEYLGLTGTRLRGADMIACELATHFLLSKDLHLLENALDKVTSSDTAAISQLLSKFTLGKNDLKEQSAYYTSRLPIINKCFSRETVEDILLALEKQAEIGKEKWVVDAINSLKSTCPTSLKICLRSLREGRWQSLEQCLARDYTISYRTAASHDFYEGVRAMLFDKDKNPKWQPSKLELVTEEMIDQYFVEVKDDKSEPLRLPPRSNSIVAATSKL